jgi:hypothetical protein
MPATKVVYNPAASEPSSLPLTGLRAYIATSNITDATVSQSLLIFPPTNRRDLFVYICSATPRRCNSLL